MARPSCWLPLAVDCWNSTWGANMAADLKTCSCCTWRATAAQPTSSLQCPQGARAYARRLVEWHTSRQCQSLNFRYTSLHEAGQHSWKTEQSLVRLAHCWCNGVCGLVSIIKQSRCSVLVQSKTAEASLSLSLTSYTSLLYPPPPPPPPPTSSPFLCSPLLLLYWSPILKLIPLRQDTGAGTILD